MQFLIPQNSMDSNQICQTDFSCKNYFEKCLLKEMEKAIMVRARDVPLTIRDLEMRGKYKIFLKISSYTFFSILTPNISLDT